MARRSHRFKVPALPVRKEICRSIPQAEGGILIVGVDKLLTGLAKCCKPAPPDPIIGFITRGRGVTIHRQGCASLARLSRRKRRAADRGGLGISEGGALSGRYRDRGAGQTRAAARYFQRSVARKNRCHCYPDQKPGH